MTVPHQPTSRPSAKAPALKQHQGLRKMVKFRRLSLSKLASTSSACVSPKHVALGFLVFMVAFLPRVLNLGQFLTADEFLWVDRARNFLAGITNPDYECTTRIVGWQAAHGLECTLRTGHPGVTAMWSGVLGFTLKWLWDGQPMPLHDYVVAISTNPLDASFISWTRLGVVLVTSLSIVGVYLLLGRLFNQRLALLTALLMALNPFHIALSRVIHHDALSSSFMLLSVLTAFVYWGQRPSDWPHHVPISQRHKLWLMLSGIFAGFGFLSKLSALFLGPMIALIGLWFTVRQFRAASKISRQPIAPRFVTLLADGSLWFCTALMIVTLFWPAMWVIPQQLFEVVFSMGSAYSEGGHAKGNFFLGQVYQDPGWLFYPVTWAYRTTPIVMVGLLSLMISSLRHWISPRNHSLREKSDASYLSLIVCFIIGYTLMSVMVAKKQERYFLPVYPWLDLLAAYGFMVIARWGKLRQKAYPRLSRSQTSPRSQTEFGNEGDEFGNEENELRRLSLSKSSLSKSSLSKSSLSKSSLSKSSLSKSSLSKSSLSKPVSAGSTDEFMNVSRGYLIFLTTLVAAAVLLIAPHYPYYFTYANPLLGGLPSAAQNITVGWGEGLELAADSLHQTGPPYPKVASWYESTFAPFYQGQTISYSKEKGKALAGDYVTFYINQRQRAFPDPLFFDFFETQFDPVHVIQLHGVDHVWIYPSLGIDHYVDDQVHPGIAALLAWQWAEGDKPLTPGQPANFALYWEYLGKQSDEPFFMRLLDGQQRVWAEGLSQLEPAKNPAVKAWQVGQILSERGRLTVPLGTPPGYYRLQIGIYTAAEAVKTGELLFELPADESLITVGHNRAVKFELPSSMKPINQPLGDSLTLLGAATAYQNGHVSTELYWQVEQPISAEADMHIGLMNNQGEAVQAWFNLTLGETIEPDTTVWHAGDIVHTRWQLELLPEVSGGTYQVELVWPSDIEQTLSVGAVWVGR